MHFGQRLSEISELPTLPEVVVKIHSLITSDEGDAALLARYIEQDPSLSARILRVANSSYYAGHDTRISSVQRAITRIGFNETGHIAMSVGLIKKFYRKQNIINHRQFWRHSLSAGYLNVSCLKVLNTGREAEDLPGATELFLTGLLHDIGILILDQFFHDEFEKILDNARRKDIPFPESEKMLYPGETHAELGSSLLEHWKLDTPVINGVRFHHNPDPAPSQHRTVCLSTYLSEYLLCNTGQETLEGRIPVGNKNVVDELITGIDITDLLERAAHEVEHSDLVLALDTPG